MAEIKLEEVGFSYDTKSSKLEVLDSISFSAKKNEFIAIIGPSGCGKTTLLKIMCGLIKPLKGKISIDKQTPEKARKKRMFGFVFQNESLLPWKTVLENVYLPMEIIKRKKPAETEKYSQLLKLVGVSEFENYLPSQLSIGMKQRVAIARTLSFNPKILLMDEPFSALDEIRRDQLNYELLQIWKKIKHTIIFVTHSISEAIFLADKIIVLSKRPARVKEIVKVNLPRPRILEMKDSYEFIELKKHIRTILENEE